MSDKTRVPAAEGWFSTDEPAHLLGSRCTSCGTYCFPQRSLSCPNPACAGRQLDEVPLSREGTVWSCTTNRYQPPRPYVSREPFEPYSIAAVELAAEKMVVLGQVADGAGPLAIGRRVELVLETLYEDDEHDYLVWKWRPL